MATLTVGAGQTYSTIAAAVAASKDGDTVEIQAGTYTNDFFAINTDITLKGVGGMAKLVATESPPNGKGIITTNGDITLQNLELSGAQVPDGNGAGIRYEGGNLTVTDSYIHDNQDGLLANSVADGHITVLRTEFDHNGTGDGHTHNLYVGAIASLTVEDSYLHDAVIGHQIKSRAAETTVTNSRIYDGENGTGSYGVDLPNGGVAHISGNVFQQAATGDNPYVIHYGGEGEPYADSSLSITDNTVVNELVRPGAGLLANETGVTAVVEGTTAYGLSVAQIATGAASVTATSILTVLPSLDLLPVGGSSGGTDTDGAGTDTAPVTEPVTAPATGTDAGAGTGTGTAPPSATAPVEAGQPATGGSETPVEVALPGAPATGEGTGVVVTPPAGDGDVTHVPLPPLEEAGSWAELFGIDAASAPQATLDFLALAEQHYGAHPDTIPAWSGAVSDHLLG